MCASVVNQEKELSPQRKRPGNMHDKFGRIYLTDDLPGIGGRIKDRPEDFIVEEIPLYDFSDQGNFAFLLLEKVNLSTLDLVALIRKQLDLRDEEVGLAGWKDKRAITRQWVSVPREKASESRLAQLASDGIKILQIRHHTNKLRTGHLLGNRFSILIHQPDAEAEIKANAIIQRLQTHGLPNFYGPQRFGAAGNNPEKGRPASSQRTTTSLHPSRRKTWFGNGDDSRSADGLRFGLRIRRKHGR